LTFHILQFKHSRALTLRGPVLLFNCFLACSFEILFVLQFLISIRTYFHKQRDFTSASMANSSHCPQSSPFLTLLPLEIRQQIYFALLSAHSIHVCLTHNGESLTLPSCHPALEILSLPLTCHQMSVIPLILSAYPIS